ncbi:MAG: ABC-type multidrug transport system, permease component [Bacteroidetes bacterium]|jgi:ABC-2 type transport system permease protein|nr:ABC-type multidrug transport system, permease component [Bacteroidota bacterium]
MKLKAAIIKEILILLRDRVGLAILFIMPMILIFVMTLIQDSAFKTLNEKGISIVFVNNDNDSLGIAIERGLRSSELCTVFDSVNGKPATAESAQQAVAEGQFLIGIVIPPGATAAVKNNVLQLVSQTLGQDSVNVTESSDSVEIKILIDPITKKSFIASVTSSLREYISGVKTRIMFESFSEEISSLIPDKEKKPSNAFQQTQIIKYTEVYASKSIGEVVPNAVQHNVPAWAIFAMFFIVMPLSGSIMKEKTEGSIFRLHTMPSSYLLLLNGKIIVYVLVCLLQLLLMLSVGKIFLPMLGLPVLYMGQSITGIIIISVATAFAATGYAVLVGTIASTEQQGSIMGALSILLLSALGGIWVPTYVMPQVMRNLSAFSPLNWSLEGFYELFLRGGDVYSVIGSAIKLMIFFVITLGISSWINKARRRI